MAESDRLSYTSARVELDQLAQASRRTSSESENFIRRLAKRPLSKALLAATILISGLLGNPNVQPPRQKIDGSPQKESPNIIPPDTEIYPPIDPRKDIAAGGTPSNHDTIPLGSINGSITPDVKSVDTGRWNNPEEKQTGQISDTYQ